MANHNQYIQILYCKTSHIYMSILSKFKLLIPDDIHYYQSSIQNMFPTFIYDYTYAQCKNSMDYIIKLLTISPIFLMEGSSNSTFLKRLYSLLWLLCTFRDIQPSYVITSCNIPFFIFVVFWCVTTFSSSHFSKSIIFITSLIENVEGGGTSLSATTTYSSNDYICQNLTEKP